MNVDRLPDDTVDPRPDAEPTRSTDTPAPENPAPPDPEHRPRAERAPAQERKPDQEQQPDKGQDPAREHPPVSSPTETDSPANNTPDPAEPRSRQEHADYLPVPDAASQPPGPADPTDQEATDQHEIEGTESHQDSGHANKASNQEALADDMDTSSSAPQDQEAFKPDNDIASADDWTGALTDKWAEHLVEVREGLDSARREGLTSKRLYTIDGAGEIWIEERDRLHDSIIEDLYAKAADVPCEFNAIIAGGLGGAGKTTVLTQYAGIDLSQYLMINPDAMKEEMSHRGMIPEVEGLSPMEASELVHEESSYLAGQLALRAQTDGKNLIWDITMSSEESVTKRINELASAGYTRIDGLFVDISVGTSLRRIESRHREGHDKYLVGDGPGGRYVPPEVIKSQEDPEWGSKNMRTFSAVKQRFYNWSIYDNSKDGRQPILVEANNKQQINNITGERTYEQ
jgi:predicted ABC-type ATPase